MLSEKTGLGFRILAVCCIGKIFCSYSKQKAVTKCLSGQEKSSFTITCPSQHVVSKLDVQLAVSKQNTCQLDPRDCFGLSKSLLQQQKACYWKQTCRITVDSRHVLNTPSAKSTHCKGRKPNYILIGIPQCVRKDVIYDICLNKPRHINSSYGLIKSHTSSAKRKNRIFKCRKRLRLPKNSTLVIEYQDRNTGTTNGLRIRSRNDKKIWTSYGMRSRRTKYINIQDGLVEFVWRGRSGRKEGFVLKYSVVNTETLNSHISLEEFNIHSSIRKRSTILNWVDKVSASIQECTSWKPKELSINCPTGSVIFSLDVTAAVPRRKQTCMAKKTYCHGLTPELLVQSNQCYWKPQCDIGLRGLSFIASTQRTECIGQLASVMAVSGFQCIQKNAVSEICQKPNSSRSYQKYEIIKSHNHYPWHYPANKVKCQRKIKIGRGRQLYLHLIDIDIDSATDTFTIYHIYKGCRTLVADDKSRNVKAILIGGRLVVSFQTSRQSRTGKGFLLAYKRVKADPGTKISHKCNNEERKRKDAGRRRNIKRKRKSQKQL